MNDDTPIMLNILYGYVEIVQTRKVENGRLYLGGYSITYGRDGKEVSRSENQWNCSLGYDEPEPRRTLWDCILDWWGGRLPPRTTMDQYAAMLGPAYEDRGVSLPSRPSAPPAP